MSSISGPPWRHLPIIIWQQFQTEEHNRVSYLSSGAFGVPKRRYCLNGTDPLWLIRQMVCDGLIFGHIRQSAVGIVLSPIIKSKAAA